MNIVASKVTQKGKNILFGIFFDLHTCLKNNNKYGIDNTTIHLKEVIILWVIVIQLLAGSYNFKTYPCIF